MARGISGRALGGTKTLGQPVFALISDYTVADGTHTIGPEKAAFDFEVIGGFYVMGAAGTGGDTIKVSIVDAAGTSTDICTAFDLQYDNPGVSGSGTQADENTEWLRLKDDVSLVVPAGGKLTITLAGGANVSKVTALCVGRG